MMRYELTDYEWAAIRLSSDAVPQDESHQRSQLEINR
jgi:hypothetical protein